MAQQFDEFGNPIYDTEQAPPGAATPATGGVTGQAGQGGSGQPATSPWNREAFRDAWMGTGTDVGRQNDVLGQYGITLDGAGRGTLPSGETMDLRIGARGGQNLAGWTGVAGGGAKTGQAAGSGDMGSGSGSIGSGANAPMTGQMSELYNMLMQRATQGLNVDRNTPAIRAQADAYSANAERARRNYLADTAERSSPYTNLQGEARQTAEQMGRDTGSFEAELVAREQVARRNEIAQALSSMQGVLSQDQSLALQKELAYLNNAIQQQQVGLQGQSLGLQREGMNMQNDQFLRSFGLQEADRASYWDAVRSGLLNN